MDASTVLPHSSFSLLNCLAQYTTRMAIQMPKREIPATYWKPTWPARPTNSSLATNLQTKRAVPKASARRQPKGTLPALASLWFPRIPPWNTRFATCFRAFRPRFSNCATRTFLRPNRESIPPWEWIGWRHCTGQSCIMGHRRWSLMAGRP